MANDCCGTMRVVSKDRGAIDRFEKIMQYKDDEFFCYRVFEFERTSIAKDGDLWVAEFSIDVAWSSHIWFHDKDKPNEHIIKGYEKTKVTLPSGEVITRDDWTKPIHGTAHYTSVTHLCKVLGVGVELWTTEPGCGFEEHAICDSLGRFSYNTAEYSDEIDDDGETVGEKHGFENFGDWLSASEIYGGANTCPLMGGKENA